MIQNKSMSGLFPIINGIIVSTIGIVLSSLEETSALVEVLAIANILLGGMLIGLGIAIIQVTRR